MIDFQLQRTQYPTDYEAVAIMEGRKSINDQYDDMDYTIHKDVHATYRTWTILFGRLSLAQQEDINLYVAEDDDTVNFIYESTTYGIIVLNWQPAAIGAILEIQERSPM